MFGAELVVQGEIIMPPSLSYTEGGNARCNFTIVVRRDWKDRNGNRQETRATFPVVCWGSLADNVAHSLDKGDRCLVWGRIEERVWQDEHRDEHTRLELNATDVGACMFYGPCLVTRNPRRGESPETAVRSAPAPRDRRDDYEEPF
jgi:single-strand DNA-binding protein